MFLYGFRHFEFLKNCVNFLTYAYIITSISFFAKLPVAVLQHHIEDNCENNVAGPALVAKTLSFPLGIVNFQLLDYKGPCACVHCQLSFIW